LIIVAGFFIFGCSLFGYNIERYFEYKQRIHDLEATIEKDIAEEKTSGKRKTYDRFDNPYVEMREYKEELENMPEKFGPPALLILFFGGILYMGYRYEKKLRRYQKLKDAA